MTRLLLILIPLAAAPTLAQAPSPISRTALIREIDAAFAIADTNRDGFVDLGELEKAEIRQGQERKAALLRDREGGFRQLDSNRDGQLSLYEFNAVAAAAPLPKADPTATLNRFDVDKDGKVSIAENRALAVARFDRADTNRDGTIGLDEQRAGQSR